MQALTSAYKFNPRLDAERARLRATDEEVPRAISGYRPQIFGSADVGYRKVETRGGGGGSSQETHPRGYGVDLSQPLFRGFRTLNTVREAESVVRAGRATLHIIEQSVLLEAVIAYADVVRDQAVVRLRENNVNVLTRELRATQDRFAVGEVTRTDVAQAEARRAGAISALDLARANLRTSRAAFERVIGHPASNLVDPGVPERMLPRTQQEAIAIAGQENPNVVAALYREQAARHVVDRIWGELLPEVSVDASYNRRFGLSENISQSDTTEVTGRLTVPIYQGGEVHARVRQAKHTHVSRLQEVEQFRTETLADVVASWARLEASRAQLVSDTAQVEANRIALAGVREEERVGQRTLLDVLNAELELLNAQVNLVTTRRDLAVSAYSLLTSVGRLSAEHMGLGVAVYDAEAHYFEVRRKWWGISITHADGRREDVDLWETHGQDAPVK
ncbi:MAG: TolC family outer membrane protein [Hyphomicrobiaceae bacterium]|nr:TolC family outer membrane protein [Hyphomicrobiaceae bacterium]